MDYNRLREQMHKDLRTLRAKKPQKPVSTHEELAGRFIDDQIKKTNRTVESVANDLDLPPEIIHLMIRGQIPVWFLSNEGLHRLAEALDCSPVILASLYGLKVKPGRV